MRASRTSIAALVSMALLVSACTPSLPETHRTATLIALTRIHRWLGGAKPTPATPYGFHCLDAWSWVMLAEMHPDPGVRADAGAHADLRLRGIARPPEWTGVSLSYWGLALHLMARRGLPIDAQLAEIDGVDVARVLASSTPTTRYWTLALLARAGASVAPDVSDTFLAERMRARSAAPLTLKDVYAIYHEVAPAAGLGLLPLTGLDGAQIAAAREILAEGVELSAASGDTDALAEALAAAAILDQRHTAAYQEGLEVLLSRQHAEGPFRSERDARKPVLTVDDYRHVVVVGTLALLTSLAEFVPEIAD